MVAILKRYAVALSFLILVIVLMLIGTIGATMLGDQMIEDIGNQPMKPRGENIIK